MVTNSAQRLPNDPCPLAIEMALFIALVVSFANKR